jgi:K+-sensing histidine kinase KdpD
MRPGYELIREQLFIRRELKERVFWLVKIRWWVAGMPFIAMLGIPALHLDIARLPLSLVGMIVLAYNAGFLGVAKWLEHRRVHAVTPFLIFAHVQISLDLSTLFAVIAMTGGTSSPLQSLIICHIVLAGILLAPTAAFLYAGITLAAIGLLQFLPRVSNWGGLPNTWQTILLPTGWQGAEAILHTIAFGAAVLFSAFLISAVRGGLQKKGRQLLAISRELEMANAKLLALYEMVKEIGRHSNLQELLDSATRQAATLMGVKACSIKLLDEEKKHLRFAATYGLSQDYIARDQLEVAASPINRKIIEGEPYMVGVIDKKDRLQYSEDIAKEGIGAMVCLPLRGNNSILGVFCIYGEKNYGFGKEEVDFFTLMTELTGIAVERVKWDLTKSWFMAKVTHNLRSPLGAVLSMVKLVRNGYLGALNEQQNATLERCERRIENLVELINDLLTIGKERTELGITRLGVVYPHTVLHAILPLFDDQALRKQITLSSAIAPSVPPVMATDGLIEDLFNNLISNAIKYTPDGGRVDVALRSENGGAVVFEVADTGIGMSETDLACLFSQFFRAESAKKLVTEGTGLGLVIVKEILERLGGTIRVSSKVGEGSRFICSIPGAPGSDEPETP